MRSVFFLLSVFLTTGQLIYGQKLVFKEESYPKLKGHQSLAITLGFVPSTFLVVANHEIGHTAIAKLSGDQDATFQLYGSLPQGGTCFGCSFYDYSKLSDFENALVPIGGFVFSQGLAIGTDALLKQVSMPKGLQRFAALTYLLAKFDMSFQSLQGVMRNNDFNAMAQTGIPSGTDVNAFAFFASNGRRTGYNFIRVGMVALSLLDIYLFRKTIMRNWKILMNKGYYINE